jgi:hypothetical protein
MKKLLIGTMLGLLIPMALVVCQVQAQGKQYSPNSDWRLIKNIALQGIDANGWKATLIIVDQSSAITCKYAKVKGDGMIGALLGVDGIGISEVVCDEKSPTFVNVEYDANGNVISTEKLSIEKGNYFGAMIIRILRNNGKL